MDIAPHDDLPEEVTKLGDLLAEFHGGRLVSILCWIFGVLAILLGLTCLGLSGIMLMGVFAKGGHAKGSFKSLFFGFVSLSAGIGLIRKARLAGGLRVFVCTDGILECVRGRQTQIMRWEDINQITRSVDVKSQKLVINTAAQLILEDRQGQQLIFNETVSGFRELRQMVEEHTLKFMLPPAIEAFQGGAAIGFGTVSVSPEEVCHGRKTLPWDQFDRAEISKGRLILYSREGKRPFGRVELAKVPNAHVLLALTEHVRVRDVQD